MNKTSEEFWDFVRSQLEILDARLSSANQPVHGRPMLAAMQFVTECMVSVGDEDVGDDFLLQDWFGDILAATTRWYKSRYGDALLKMPSDNIRGVVVAFGTPLNLQIPRIAEFDTAMAAVKRIVFADGVLDEEDPMNWVNPAPDFGDANSETASKLRKDVLRIATALRQAYRRLLIADFTSPEEQGIASSIEGHLEKSAADIKSNRYGAAIWETHLGVEKALKLFLRQTGASVPQTHDLIRLVADAEQAKLPSCNHLNLRGMPLHHDAIRHRYAELPAPDLETVMDIYEVAIHTIAHVAGALKQSSFADHRELYIRALPWHPKWKQGQPDNKAE